MTNFELNLLNKYRNFFLLFLILLILVFLILTYSGNMSNKNQNQDNVDSNVPVDMFRNNTVTDSNVCVVTGCNGEICIEKEEQEKNPQASICLWKEEYRCLRYSICEKQKDGKCGWTKTQEYLSCMAKISK